MYFILRQSNGRQTTSRGSHRAVHGCAAAHSGFNPQEGHPQLSSRAPAGLWLNSGPTVADEKIGFGICEVVTVPANDELPYVFEVTGGQKLVFSISSSDEVDLVLCEEDAYDDWIDAGFETEQPLEALLVLRHGTKHSLEFMADCDSVLVAILINTAEQFVEAVVAANVLDSIAAQRNSGVSAATCSLKRFFGRWW